MSTSRVRVHEISKQLGVSNASVIDTLAKEFGVNAKSHSSTVEQDIAEKLIARLQKGGAAAPAKKQDAPKPEQPKAEATTSKASESSPTKVESSTKPATATAPQPAAFGTANAGQKAPSASANPSLNQPTQQGPAGQVSQQSAARPAQPGQLRSPSGNPAAPGQRPVQRDANGQPIQKLPPKKIPAAIRIVPERTPGSPEPPRFQNQNRPQQPQGLQGAGGYPQRQGQRPGQPPNRPQGQGGYPPRPGQQFGQQGHGPGGFRPQQQQRPGFPPAAHAGDRVGRPDGAPPPIDQPSGKPVRTVGKDSKEREKSKRDRFSDAGSAAKTNTSQGKRGGNRNASRNPTRREAEEEAAAAVSTEPKIVTIDDSIVVRDLAVLLRLRDTEIIKHLFMKGMMVTVNQTLDMDFARTVAKEFEFEVEDNSQQKHEGEYSHLAASDDKKLDEEKFQNLSSRSPVVSIMGHVDHGKTTLLDSIRETRHKVVDTEAGGITQSIGAYTVQKGEQRIVFLDTPGHEAFTSMRMRGAQATDIAILVVAADDGIMPQTIEAINHAKVAKIPIIVAVNKIDKAGADPDKVLSQLADHGLSAEKWGGDTLTVEVSALQRLGLDDLLDSILLVSELLELKADATVSGEGVIIEAQLDKRMGSIATALVRNGVLKVGDNVLIGSVGGRVRALIDDHGQRINEAGPSTPVSILGLDGVPNAGDTFRVMENDKEFKQELNAEKQRLREERIGVTRSVAGFSGRLETEENKESQFNLLVKADTQGSLEAVLEVLQRMTNDEVKINIVHSATGDISEADVMLASTANALLIGFNTKADPAPQRLAEQSGVLIKKYDVIYHITEDIEKWVLGQLSPETEETLSGIAEVRQIFKTGKSGIIVGCMVTQGKVVRNAKAVVMRDGKEIHTGILANLKRFKDDVKEVASGYECGVSFDKFQDLKEGDTIEVFTVKSLERTSL